MVTEVFSPEGQAWLDHGFAFLTINYRGSTTFGRAFQERIYGNPGHWEVEDIAAGHDWLVEQGIAVPGRVLLTGWSYGGYLTLQALGRRPDLWGGGMAGLADADWVMVYEDAVDTLKGFLVAGFGGTPGEKPEVYAASSPITYAEDVAAPVLIIQGRNDTRATPRQIEAYEEKLRSLGKPIEVHWFDAGHMGPFAQVEQSIEHQERFIRFAQRIVAASSVRGGRGLSGSLRGLLALLSALLLVGGAALLRVARVPTAIASSGWPVTEGYDPANPATALLEPGVPDNGLFGPLDFFLSAGGGALFLVTGLFVLGLAIGWPAEKRARRRRKEPAARGGQETAGRL